MAELMKAEIELKKLIDDFTYTAKQVVNIIVHWKPDCIYLQNMFGKGGRKWVAGGLLVRECKNWVINGNEIVDGDLSFKIAEHEFESLNLLQ